jgi:DNA-binding GntR family transcriptional regulator
MSRDEVSELRQLLKRPESGVPKYLHLRNSLAAAINHGRWKPGVQIPTEDRLTEASGLSLGTVQKALRALADDGMVVRRQGMGTFVADSERPMNAPFYHCRFLDDDGELLPIFSKFVRRGAASPRGAAPSKAPWSEYLPGDSVLCVERIFSINHEFSIYTHLYFDATRLPALANASPARLSSANLKDLIAHEQHVPLARFSETLSVRVFTKEVCAAIGAKPRASGAVLEIVAYDRQGQAVYFQDLMIPPTERRLFIAT